MLHFLQLSQKLPAFVTTAFRSILIRSLGSFGSEGIAEGISGKDNAVKGISGKDIADVGGGGKGGAGETDFDFSFKLFDFTSSPLSDDFSLKELSLFSI